MLIDDALAELTHVFGGGNCYIGVWLHEDHKCFPGYVSRFVSVAEIADPNAVGSGPKFSCCRELERLPSLESQAVRGNADFS